jgi:alpha-amylase
MSWNKAHFTGVDVDNKTKAHAIWRFSGKEWAREVDNTAGNFDYLYLEISLSFSTCMVY